MDPDEIVDVVAGTSPVSSVTPVVEDASPRPVADYSGLTAEELAAVPDLHGGDEPVVANPTNPAKPGDPNIAANQARAAAAAAAAPGVAQPAATPTIRDAARQYGFNLDQYTDDSSAFAALVQAAQNGQRNDYFAQVGQRVAPHAADFQAFLAAKAAPAAAPARPAYMPPEFNESDLNFVEKDQATGVWRAKPGVDPAYADRVNKYQDWQTQFQRNPAGFIQPMIQDEARRIAAEVVQQQFAGHQATQTINQIIQTNGAWLYQANEQGQRYTDTQGRFIPTPEGTLYYQKVAELGRSGIKDPATLNRLAIQLVRAELPPAVAPVAQTPAAVVPPTTVQARAAAARPNVNPGQAVDPNRRSQQAGTQSDDTGLSLSERIRKELAAAGVNDSDIADSAMNLYGVA